MATTVTELIAMAPAVSTGFRKPSSPKTGRSVSGTPETEKTGYRMPAATGMRSTL